MRTRAIAAIVACGALVGAGCGTMTASDDRGGKRPVRPAKLDAVSLISESAQATADEGSARVKLVAKIGIGGDVHSVTMDGVLDLAHNAGAFTVDLGALTGTASSGTIEMRFVDGILYVSIDALRGQGMGELLPPDVKWVSFDLANLAEQLGVDMSDLGAGADPGVFTDALDALRGAGNVTEIGPDTVGDVATTHYRVELDVQKALEQLPADARAEAADGLAQLFPDAVVPADVWIDAEGRLRRMQFSTDGSSLGTAGVDENDGVSITLEFSDFGTDAKVEAPPESETKDLRGLLGSALDSLMPSTTLPTD